METEQLETQQIASAGVRFRARALLTLGWLLFGFSAVLLVLHFTWMWHRLGRSAPLIAVGLGMDALVGLVLIVVGSRVRRNFRNKL
ncbi:MAG TPA: hypothetical protein VGL89_02925 [Candidatus Koribacter sp.]|jgi:hypothetical protein